MEQSVVRHLVQLPPLVVKTFQVRPDLFRSRSTAVESHCHQSSVLMPHHIGRKMFRGLNFIGHLGNEGLPERVKGCLSLTVGKQLTFEVTKRFHGAVASTRVSVGDWQ